MGKYQMSEQKKESVNQWCPPERPEWVKRINEEGECMDIREVVPLDEGSLIASAKRSTGLSDFGESELFIEPFRVYIKALDEEAQLNLLGRLRARQEILLCLKSLLQIEDWYKRHPEIEKEEIKQPIVVIGQGRSGTSFLQNVLASNPEYGTLLHWEMSYPCPPPEKETYKTNPRIERAGKWITQWNRVVPELQGMHEFGAGVPFECTIVMSIAFLYDGWLSAFGQVPSFNAYIAQKSNPETALRFHKRALKLLQWKNPRSHWVLKDVLYLGNLETLFKVYPDACVVWSHRDPVRASASFVNFLGCLQYAGSDHPLSVCALDFLTDPANSAAFLNSVIDRIESGSIPKDRIFNIHYKDLVEDTLGTIDAIHNHFDIALSSTGRQGIAAYLKENPRDSRPHHRYPIPEGENLIRAREVYKRYQDYFNVPTE